ncbi:MAG: amidohydrolase family protein [Cyclobacteriaceae bacterium]
MPNRRKFLQKSAQFSAGALAAPALFGQQWKEAVPIVDTHVHFWELDRLEYPWLENKESPLSRDFTVSDYQQATQGHSVEKIVFVESGRVPQQYQDEVEWVQQLAEEHKWIGGIVAYFPVDKGQSVQAELEKLASYPLVRGIRSMSKMREQMESAQYQAGLKLLADHDLSLDIHINASAAIDFLPLIDQHPNLVFVLNHLGLPDVKNGELAAWKNGMRQLAERPNVYCKLSGLLTRCHPEQMKSTHLKPYIHTPMEHFGTDRVMFGSDWPVLTRADSFSRWMQVLDETLTGLNHSELTAIFAGNAKKVYRL